MQTKMDPSGIRNFIHLFGLGVWIFLGLSSTAETSKILIVPVSTYSHVHYFVAISEKLVQRDHEVYAVLNGDCTVVIKAMEKVGIQVVPFYTMNRTCYTEGTEFDRGEWLEPVFKSDDVTRDNRDFLAMFSSIALANTVEMFNEDYVAELKALHLDLIINDGVGITWHNYILSYKLDVPYITFTTMYYPLLMGLPALTSFSTNVLNTFSEKMNFFERLSNTIDTYLVNKETLSYDGSDDELVSRFAPEKPPVSIHELVKRSKLWLLNTDIVLDYPRVTLPHVINVGGVTAKPGKPLPDIIRAIIDGAENGFILFSYGSLISKLPTAIVDRIMAALSQVTEITIIMKYSGPPLQNVPSHIKVLKWIPQNDILAHPKVRLFIAHCGNNGQFEAVYHGVPMLGMPIFSDQFYNTNRMAVKGYGLVLNAKEFTVKEMTSKIREMLSNSSYRNNIRKASRIFHSRPESPTERAAYWIEHVIEHGAEHLYSEALRMPWYQYWLVDIATFLVITALSCGIFFVGIIVLMYMLLCKNADKAKIA